MLRADVARSHGEGGSGGQLEGHRRAQVPGQRHLQGARRQPFFLPDKVEMPALHAAGGG